MRHIMGLNAFEPAVLDSLVLNAFSEQHILLEKNQLCKRIPAKSKWKEEV